MTDPGSPSAAISQTTITSGTSSPYILGRPIKDKLPFTSAYVTGALIRYRVTDTSGMLEVCDGIYTSPDQLSRDTLVISSTGSFIAWPETGQRIITPIVRFPICDTPPTVGQVLEWDGAEWCPANLPTPTSFPLCVTPPTTGQILVFNGTDWCPADLCPLVEACMNPPPPTCLPFAVYANRLAVTGYAGDIYTIKRSSDNTTQSFAPSGVDAPQSAISAFIGAGSGAVTVWNDQSGNGHDVVENLIWDGNPLWLANQVNSHPALQFEKFAVDTTDRGLSTASDVTFTTAAWTVFLVLKHDTYTDADTYPDVGAHMDPVSINGGPPIDFSISRWVIQMDPDPLTSPTGGSVFMTGDDAGFNNGVGLQAITSNAADTYDIFEFACNNNQSDTIVKRNGADWDTIDATYNQYATTDFSITGPLAVGGTRVGLVSASNPWVGWIAEIWIYNCVLTSAERDTRRADIAAYYGISV